MRFMAPKNKKKRNSVGLYCYVLEIISVNICASTFNLPTAIFKCISYRICFMLIIYNINFSCF